MTIELFGFDGAEVRVIIREGEPWFVAADACPVIGIKKPRDAVAQLDDDERASMAVDTPGGRQQMTVVNESGLYSLTLISRSPNARRFRKWVTSEVLPSLRKTGSYGQADTMKALNDPATLRGLLLENVEKVLALQGKVAEDRPKVEVYDRIVASGDTVGFRQAAKLIFDATGKKENAVKEAMTSWRWIQRLGGRLAPASYGQQNITQRGVARAIERINSWLVAVS